jgi:hypothetical protein
MPIFKTIAIIACLAAPQAPVLAQTDPTACSSIVDDQARLKSFDGIFPGPARGVAQPADRAADPGPTREDQRITADAPLAPEPGGILTRLIGTQRTAGTGRA